MAGRTGGAVDQGGDDNRESLGGETPCKLILERDAGRKPGDLLGCLNGIGKGDDKAGGRAHRFEPESFAEDVFEHRPADLVHPEGGSLRDYGLISAGGDTLHVGGSA
jgi:hypothetical protein